MPAASGNAIEAVHEMWCLIWREKSKDREGKEVEDWGWLSSLDGDQDCTTQDPKERLRYGSREAAKVALWRFRRDNKPRPNETIRLVRVRARPAAHAPSQSDVAASPHRGGDTVTVHVERRPLAAVVTLRRGTGPLLLRHTVHADGRPTSVDFPADVPLLLAGLELLGLRVRVPGPEARP
jgi:hypothetical protein